MNFKDLDKVYELEHELFPNPWPRSFFEHDLISGKAIAFVVEYGHKLIAYSLASCQNKKFHITNIAVHRKYQRTGIGTELMNRLEKIALDRGCAYAYLEVRTNNLAAIKMYENLGYSIVRKNELYYINGDDAYVMDKELI
jgi:ribosomal-protein-alanine N-acetyltransferase